MLLLDGRPGSSTNDCSDHGTCRSDQDFAVDFSEVVHEGGKLWTRSVNKRSLKPNEKLLSTTTFSLRAATWLQLDFNGNKWVSLAETENGKWVGARLINFYDEKENKKGWGLHKHFYPVFHRPRAFLYVVDHGAATKTTQKGGDKSCSNAKITGAMI